MGLPTINIKQIYFIIRYCLRGRQINEYNRIQKDELIRWEFII